MKKFLIIDDMFSDFRMVEAQLQEYPVKLYWVKSISLAKEILSNSIPGFFDAVYLDCLGTSMNLEQEIKNIKHQNIILTSGVFFPVGKLTNEFVPKDSLAKNIISRM